MFSSLRRLQLIQNYILQEVKRICEKHHIQYFLVGGSLIGAVRHHGFIPWDDDIDIGFLRSDYERFLSVCADELSDDFFLQTKETDNSYALPWAKLRLNGTKRVSASVQNMDAHVGIDIDLFPYDNISSSKFVVWFHSNLCWFIRGIYSCKCKWAFLNQDKSPKKKIGMLLCRIIAVFVSKNFVSHLMDSIFKMYSDVPTEYVMNLSSPYSYKKEIIPREWIDNVEFAAFESMMHPIPMEYHKYLSQLFGDYMTPLPETERVTHLVVDVDFGEYSSISEDDIVQ